MPACDAWTTTAEIEECGFDSSGFDADHLTTHITAVSDWLWEMTGHRFGICTTTERPCRECGCRGYRCVCAGDSVLELSYGPISGTPEVVIDGAAFTSFVVVAPNMLVRTDDQAWPWCQSLIEGEGTVVTYDHGEAVPPLGRLAASDLVIQGLNECDAGTCSIPANVTGLNRRGVTYDMDAEKSGRSLRNVGLFLGLYPRYGPGISRVDRPRGIVTAGPA